MARGGSYGDWGWFGLALAGGGLWIAARALHKGGAVTSDIANYLRTHMQGEGLAYVDDIAAGIDGTMPQDFEDPDNPGDPVAAAHRWALDVAAIGQHESGYGTDVGYFPKGDPTGWGDRGNAYGFWQLDKHYNWAFIQSADAASVSGQAHAAATKLAQNWAAFSDQDVASREAFMIITYNAGLGRVHGMVAQGATVAAADATTSQRYGKGYAANVLGIAGDWGAA